MGRILISGLINVETTLRVDAFPLTYEPVRYPFFGIQSTVSGVGYNLAKALTVLGNSIDFLSLSGQDVNGIAVQNALAQAGISTDYVNCELPQTPQSVILYDRDGNRQIHADLKDIQERVYPQDRFEEALSHCSLALLCNINFSRPFLQKARRAGRTIATDVHTISSLEDEYNRDFMEAADILFMSDERLPCEPEQWLRQVQNRYGAEIIVVGMGAAGALLAVRSDGFMERIPAVPNPALVNSIGAGDALFSAFNHVYHKCGDPYHAIKMGTVFASHKIGVAGAAEGFLDEQALEKLTADAFAG